MDFLLRTKVEIENNRIHLDNGNTNNDDEITRKSIFKKTTRELIAYGVSMTLRRKLLKNELNIRWWEDDYEMLRDILEEYGWNIER